MKGDNTSDKSIVQIVFTATAAGVYRVTVAIDGANMVNTPFSVSITPSSLSVKASTMEGSGSRGGLVGNSASFAIISRDIYGNQLTIGGATWIVALTFTERSPVDLTPSDYNDGSYAVQYLVPAKADSAYLSVKGPFESSFLDISRSPSVLTFVIDEPFSVPIMSILQDPVSGLMAGDRALFTVVARNLLGFDRHVGNETVSAALKLMKAAYSANLKKNSSFERALNVSDLRNGRYNSAFSVTLAGTYMLTVTLNGNHIQASPFTISVIPSRTSAKQSRITPSSGADLMSMAGAAKRFTLQAIDSFGNYKVYNSYDGPDLIISTLVGPTSTYCSVTNNQDSTYIISYTATVSGSYRLDIWLYPASPGQQQNDLVGSVQNSANLVKTLRISILPSDASAGDFVVNSDGLQYLQAGTIGSVAVSPRDRFGNALDISTLKISGVFLSSPGILTSSMDFIVDPSQTELQYLLTFPVTLSGNYVLAVMLETKELAGSPYSFAVSSGQVETQNCSLDANTFKYKLHTGAENTFLLRTYDVYKNEYTEGQKAFSAMLVGPQNSKGLVTDNFDGTYSITFPALQQLGQYELTIIRQQAHIAGSPFIVQAEPGVFVPQMSSASFSSDPLVAGTTRTLVVYARDGAGNQMSTGGQHFFVDIQGSSQVLTTVVDRGSGLYHANISTITSGSYLVRVLYNGELLQGGSISFAVVASEATASKSLASGDGLDSQPLIAGYYASISAIAVDKYGNVDFSWNNIFVLAITNGSAGTMNFSFGSAFMDQSGTYQLQYILTKSGAYRLWLSLKTLRGIGDGVVASAPKIVEAADTESAACTVVPPEMNCVASSKHSCTLNLTARDHFSNAVNEDGDVFIAQLLRSEVGQDSSVVQGQVSGIGGPSYRVSFAVTASGTYRLLVSRYLTPISGSNTLLVVVPGIVSPPDCTISGSGLNGAVAGFRSEFTLTARDSFGNAVESDVLGIRLAITPYAEYQAVYAGSGQYLISWTPASRGTYSISLLNQSTLLAKSPYTVSSISMSARRNLNTEISAPFCSVRALNTFVYAGETSVFVIDPRNAMQAIVTDESSLSNVHFVVEMDGTRCGQCPLLPLETAQSTTCCIDQASVQNRYNITVHFRSGLAHRIVINIYQELYDNMLHTHPILNNPFSVLVTPGELYPITSGFPRMILASGSTSLLTSVIAGSKVSVLILLKDRFGNALAQGGLENVLISVFGPVNTDLQIIDNHDGSAVVIFQQTFAYHPYVFKADYKGDYLNGFPFDFSVGPASVAARVSEAMTRGQPNSQGNPPLYTSGQIASLLIVAKDQYGNTINANGENFQAILSGPQRVYASANSMHDGYYFSNITEAIQMAGNYTLSVSYSLLDLKGSPLRLIVVPDRVLPSACSAAGVGSIYGIATSATYFSLIAKDRFGNAVSGQAAGNKFKINLFTYAKQDALNTPLMFADQSCKGMYPCANGSLLISVTGTYDSTSSSVQYVADMPAIYVLSITYDGQPVKQSSSMTCCNSSLCTGCVTVSFAQAPVANSAAFSDSGALQFL